MNNAEPISFSCPSCGSEYKMVSIQSAGESYRGNVACLRCDAVFPAGDEDVFFKYILVRPLSGKRKKQ